MEGLKWWIFGQCIRLNVSVGLKNVYDVNVIHPWKNLFIEKLRMIEGVSVLLKSNFNVRKLQIKITSFLSSMMYV